MSQTRIKRRLVFAGVSGVGVLLLACPTPTTAATPAEIEQAIVDGLDPHDWAEVTKYTNLNLACEFGQLFRFGEYCAMNLSRYMQQYLTGGWGIEGNWQQETTPL